MTLSNINIFLIITLTILIWEYKTLKNYIPYFLVFVIVSILTFNTQLWETYFFSLQNWKIIFLILITISFLIVFEICKEKSFDVYSLLILTYIGSSILIISDHLLMVYLGLELQTFSIFILIAKNRTSIKSSEAGLKYFMLGAISSGFYLLGLVLLFSFGYTLDIKELLILYQDKIILIGFLLITFSLFFKLTLFPLHFWVPDIYEGSSWDVVTLISTLPKISVLCILIQLSQNSSIILIISILSIIVGTLGALNQSKMKRLIAYSGVSHMGFAVLAFIIYGGSNYVVGSIYVAIYLINILCLLLIITEERIKNKYIIELGGIKSINKIMALSLILIILSVAGIPPLSGFLSKWFLIWTSLDKGFLFSSFIVILFSVIGMGYYLRLVKTVYFQSKDSYFIWNKILNEDNNKKKDFIFLLLGLMFFIITFLIIKLDLFINIFYYLYNIV